MALFAVMVAVLGASPDLDDGRLAFSALKYEQAVVALRRAADDPSLPASERVDAYGLLARAHLALGQADKARAAWSELLTLNPMAAEPDGAPKVRASFKQAKEAKFPPRYVEVRKTPTTPDVLELELINPWNLAVRLELWEAVDPGDFQKRELTPTANRVVASLRAGSRNYVRIVSADGVLLATLASPAEPVRGPAAQLSDVPKVMPVTPPPVVVIAAPPPVQEPPVEPKPVGLSSRHIMGIVIAGLGLAASVFGGVFFGLGSNELSLANGWPFNNLDFNTVTQYKESGPLKMTVGGVVGGVGLAAVITGVVLFLTGPSSASSAATR